MSTPMVSNDKAARFRPIFQSVGLLLLFVIYFLYEFPEYLVGKIKYVGMAALSVLLMLTLACLCLESLCFKIFHALYRDRENVGKRIVVLVMVGLASLTH